MILPSKTLLLFALIGTLLLVSTDGVSIWAPDLARHDSVRANLIRTGTPASSAQAPAQPAAVAVAEAAPAQTPVPPKTKPSLSEEVKRIHRERLACVAEPVKSADLFASKSWYVPPPPPKPAPPPKPTAPPLPFGFMGSYQEPDGRLILFLTRGERVYTVSMGDVIDGTYRVEAVVGGQLELTYLPMNIKQSLSIGEAS